MSAKLVSTFADRECRVVSATDPHGRILDFLDGSRYYFFQVAPQLYSRGWVDPVPDQLLLRKSGSAGNLTRDLWICSQELWPLDHRGGVIWYHLTDVSVLRKYIWTKWRIDIFLGKSIMELEDTSQHAFQFPANITSRWLLEFLRWERNENS
jgi:hypothetical protein